MKVTTILTAILIGLFASLIVSAYGNRPYATSRIQTPEPENLKAAFLKSSPDFVNVGKPSTVTVTGQVAVTGALIPESVNLIRYDDRGNALGVLGKMHDDGTDGDALLGDNTFSIQLALNESTPMIFGVKVSVAYKGIARRSISDLLRIYVKSEETPEQMLTQLSGDIEASRIEDALNRFSRSSLNRLALEGLTTTQKSKLATALRQAQLLELNGPVAIFKVLWPEENGAISEVRISLMRDAIGLWRVLSW